MSSSISSALATMMMFTALFGLPAIAVFGVPDFAAVTRHVNSSGEKPQPPQTETPPVDTSVSHISTDNLFSPIQKSADNVDAPTGRASTAGRESAGASPFDDTFFQSIRSSSEQQLADGGAKNEQADARLETAQTDEKKWAPPVQAIEGWELDPDTAKAPFQPILEKDLPAATTALETDEKNTSPFGNHDAASNTQLALHKSEEKDTRLVSAVNPQTTLSWQDVQQRLDALGVRHFQLVPNKNDGKFLFRCMYKDPAPRRMIVRLFEAEADEPLVAIEEVLQQIEEWKSGRQ